MSQEPVEPEEKLEKSEPQVKPEEKQQAELKEVSITQPSQPKDLISIISKLKDCTFILAGIILLFYVTGFIIVSVYLLSKGVVELEIAKARYVSVGVMFWAITSTGIGSGIAFIPRTFWSLHKRYEQLKGIKNNDESKIKIQHACLRLMAPGIATNLIVVIFLYVITTEHIDIEGRFHIVNSLDIISWLAMNLFLMFIVVVLSFITYCFHVGSPEFIERIFKSMSWKDYLISEPRSANFVLIILLALGISLLASLFSYANGIYPILNPALGGGCFPCIEFVTTQEHVDIIGDLINFDSNKKRISKPVRLLEQTNSSFIVLVEDEDPNGIGQQAVVISKELVKGFRTLTQKKRDRLVDSGQKPQVDNDLKDSDDGKETKNN